MSDEQNQPQEEDLNIPAQNVLMVDDTPENLVALQVVLEDLPCQLVTANSGPEALAKLLKQEFSLVLLDVQMPDMDGFEATERIRQSEAGSRRRTPIIALTAHAMTGDRERCLAAGMDDYVSKPFSSQDLADALERVLAADPVSA